VCVPGGDGTMDRYRSCSFNSTDVMAAAMLVLAAARMSAVGQPLPFW
jgi:hypothetical protein